VAEPNKRPQLYGTPVHDSGGTKDASPKLNSDAGPLAIPRFIVALTINEPFES
jgi:hypothetical protein